jgi:hypothetical protein
MPNFKTIISVVGAFVFLVFICKVFGDPMIWFIHWSQGVGVSTK